MLARHTPRFQVVCYTTQGTQEVVGDILEMETACNMEHKVGAWPSNACDVSTYIVTVQTRNWVSIHVLVPYLGKGWTSNNIAI